MKERKKARKKGEVGHSYDEEVSAAAKLMGMPNPERRTDFEVASAIQRLLRSCSTPKVR